ncbi:MAG: hypothetical protein A3E74_09070 [Omnitrophica bacterium RIFCSPHIGHO2_12_FULL_44_12]|nr:MAG: hypothetical protein A3E74_09070 [Omnitrophica bacterium RIFCSPHIGHO2_12_FULL_44_12]
MSPSQRELRRRISKQNQKKEESFFALKKKAFNAATKIIININARKIFSALTVFAFIVTQNVIPLESISLTSPIPLQKTPVAFADESFSVINEQLSLNNNTLIVYNQNVTGSDEIANYYAAARNMIDLNPSHICPVSLPSGQFATASQLLGARKEIVEKCICPLIPNLDRPSPCSVENLDAVSQKSPITHMVLIRGIPARLTGTGWPSDYEKPSFDYYLSYLLYRDEDIFAAGQQGWTTESNYTGAYDDSADSQPSSSVFSYIRNLNAAKDKIVAYGRIEAMTKERTIELIDRTLAAERKGVSGDFWVGKSYADDPTALFFKNLTSSRAKTTDGPIPGESGQNVIDAGIYLGNEYENNGHNAFDGFQNMIRWRKTSESCTPLCKDTADPATCRANSSDYFKEINTDCVGVADGFLGWQFRSWPVQYYGFFPPGWSLSSGGNGSVTRTPPHLMTGDAHQDSNFTDDHYLHFGELDTVETPICTNENGSISPCTEKIGVDLVKGFAFDPKLDLTQPKTYTVRLRYRASHDGGTLRIFGIFFSDTGSFQSGANNSFSLINNPSAWQTIATQIQITAGDLSGSITGLNVYIRGDFGNQIQSGIDIDGVEIIDDQPGSRMLSFDSGSFNEPYTTDTHGGDYAANVIDRLGGIAWWGSSSHHLTGGGAFYNSLSFAGAFYSGKTMGESLTYLGSYAKSGIIYGDPLYRPSSAKIYIGDDGLAPVNNPAAPYQFVRDNDSSLEKIHINAFHGHDNFQSTNWQLSACSEADVETCNQLNAWNSFETDIAAVHEHEITKTLMDIVHLFQDPPTNDLRFIVKLEVWNPGDEQNSLTNYAFFSYLISAPPQITQQPIDAAIAEGETATFTVVATGIPAPTYQWQKWNGTEFENIADATNPNYSVTATANNINSSYRCVVTNPGGTVFSNTVLLALAQPLVPDFTFVFDTVDPLTVHFFDQSTGSIAEYWWEFGDGKLSINEGKDVVHTYPSAGDYDVTLYIIDADWNSSTATKTIHTSDFACSAPEEICNGIDDNCSGQIDEGCDDDDDDYCNANMKIGMPYFCENGNPWCCNKTTPIEANGFFWGDDCADAVYNATPTPENPSRFYNGQNANPGITYEQCMDGGDNNCNGQIDEGCVAPNVNAREDLTIPANETMKIWLYSDSHLATIGAPNDQFAYYSSVLNGMKGKYDQAVVLGDLVNSGQDAPAYAMMKQTLEQNGVAGITHLITGNHDSVGNFVGYVNPNLSSANRLGNLLFILMGDEKKISQSVGGR